MQSRAIQATLSIQRPSHVLSSTLKISSRKQSRMPTRRSIYFQLWRAKAKSDENQEADRSRSSEVQESVDKSIANDMLLPGLPDAPKYPSPHLTDEEVAEYLEPLYKRSWYLGVRVLKWNRELRIPLVLAKKMDFLSFDDAVKFANELNGVIRAENHHPRISISPSGRVSLELDTHTATIPGVCPSDRKDPQHIYPGVTLRDVRLAILVERLWVRHRDELKVAKATQYETNPSRRLNSVRKNSGYRSLGFFRPSSFADDLWRNVNVETIAFMLSDEVGSR